VRDSQRPNCPTYQILLEWIVARAGLAPVLRFFGGGLQKRPSKENINSQWLLMPIGSSPALMTKIKNPCKMGALFW